MTKNVGTIDRAIRAVLGIIFILSFFFVKSFLLKIILLILGVVLIFTAITGFCGLYKILGISTCPIKEGGKT
ncbi:MAG: DUF2892 domain-containing protein [candidate division WOR-3 bacterium]